MASCCMPAATLGTHVMGLYHALYWDSFRLPEVNPQALAGHGMNTGTDYRADYPATPTPALANAPS